MQVREFIDPKTEKLVCRVNLFHDRNPEEPVAFDEFLNWIAKFNPEQEGFATYIHDSATFSALTALNAQRYRWNRNAKEPRQWYGSVTISHTNILLSRYGSWDCNVVTLAHVHRADDKIDLNGAKIIAPNMPGQLKGSIGGGYGEFYRSYVDQKGSFVLQTRPNGAYNASTQIDAPNPCPQSYDAMWGSKEKEVTHCLVYGDPGSGKSHFASTWPKPIQVVLFDPKSKGSVYYHLGQELPHALSTKEH